MDNYLKNVVETDDTLFKVFISPSNNELEHEYFETLKEAIENLDAFLVISASTFSWSDNFPNRCNETCLNEHLTITTYDSDCLPWDEWPQILKPKNFNATGKQCIQLSKESPIHVCPKIINGKKLLASCGEQSSDYRIPCVSSADSLQWYRGIKSTTFNGTKCLRWDAIDLAQKRFSGFFDFTPPVFGSHSYGIHSHENFCRNPDGLSAGPWCYIKNGDIPTREPCFLKCQESEDFQASEISNPCLSRSFLLSISSLKNESTADFYISSLPMKNRPKWISQYLIKNTEYSNSGHCYIHDKRATYFGPWTFAPFYSTDEPFRLHETFPGDSDLHGDSWERCYFACEDSVLTCIPSNYFNYYGTKQITVNGEQCIPPNILANRLQETAAKFNETFQQDKPELWQFWKLFTSKNLGDAKNFFFKNFVDRLTNPQCYNFRWFISKVEFKDFYALKPIFDLGVGCFVAKFENVTQLSTVTFEACFEQCPPDAPEPIFSNEPKLLPNETLNPILQQQIQNQTFSEEFEDQLDTGSPFSTILMLTVSGLAVTTAMIVCILHACNKI